MAEQSMLNLWTCGAFEKSEGTVLEDVFSRQLDGATFFSVMLKVKKTFIILKKNVEEMGLGNKPQRKNIT